MMNALELVTSGWLVRKSWKIKTLSCATKIESYKIWRKNNRLRLRSTCRDSCTLCSRTLISSPTSRRRPRSPLRMLKTSTEYKNVSSSKISDLSVLRRRNRSRGKRNMKMHFIDHTTKRWLWFVVTMRESVTKSNSSTRPGWALSARRWRRNVRTKLRRLKMPKIRPSKLVLSVTRRNTRTSKTTTLKLLVRTWISLSSWRKTCP